MTEGRMLVADLITEGLTKNTFDITNVTLLNIFRLSKQGRNSENLSKQINTLEDKLKTEQEEANNLR